MYDGKIILRKGFDMWSSQSIIRKFGDFDYFYINLANAKPLCEHSLHLVSMTAL